MLLNFSRTWTYPSKRLSSKRRSPSNSRLIKRHKRPRKKQMQRRKTPPKMLTMKKKVVTQTKRRDLLESYNPNTRWYIHTHMIWRTTGRVIKEQ